jgi:phospholipid/cholesterol/gamma-HCH transport system ATP-binding protein
MDGVVRAPSAFSMTLGLPPSMMATQELVVPRSMPMILPMRAVALDPMLTMYDEPFAGLDPISLDVIANIIRRLSEAMGLTSIVVSYDVAESLKIADYAIFIDNGIVVAEGPAQEMAQSGHPFVHQFVHGEEDGPVSFHYPARDLALDLGLSR